MIELFGFWTTVLLSAAGLLVFVMMLVMNPHDLIRDLTRLPHAPPPRAPPDATKQDQTKTDV